MVSNQIKIIVSRGKKIYGLKTMSKNLINALQIDHNSVKFITAQEIEIANQGSILQVLGMTEKKGKWNIDNHLDKDLLASYIKSSHLENERLAGQKITNTLVSVNKDITSKYITQELFLNNIVITEEHIRSFYESKDFTELYQSNDIPIHTLAISYKIDDKKILTEIEKNKQKPAKVGGFRSRLQKAMEQAEKQKRNNEKRK